MAAIYGSVSTTSRTEIRRAVAFGFPGEVFEVGTGYADLDHSPSPSKTYGLFWKGDGHLGNYVSRMERWKLQAEEGRMKDQEEARNIYRKEYAQAFEVAKCALEKQCAAALEDAQDSLEKEMKKHLLTLEKQLQEAFEKQLQDAKVTLERQHQEALEKQLQEAKITLESQHQDALQKMGEQHDKEISELFQDLQCQYKEESDCKLCLSEKRSRIFFPCMHFRTCAGCAEQVEGACPWCRTRVQQIFQVYT